MPGKESVLGTFVSDNMCAHHRTGGFHKIGMGRSCARLGNASEIHMAAKFIVRLAPEDLQNGMEQASNLLVQTAV